MTFIGKIFVMLNLAISLLMAVAAFGLFAGGIDWTDRTAKDNRPPGKLHDLRKEIDGVLAQLPVAEGSWKLARATLLAREEQRRKDRDAYDAEMGKLGSGNDPVNRVAVPVPNPKANAKLEDPGTLPKLEMEKAEDGAGQPLMTRGFYEEKLKEYQAKNGTVREDLGKKVKENDELVHKLVGDKETDPEPRIRGLRRELVEERGKRQGILDEQGITESLQINVAVESELILKRLDALDERIRELAGYLKKKHSVDVPSKWR